MEQPIETAIDFVVDRNDLRHCKIVPAVGLDPAAGQLLLRVDRFAFTANNVTYAVAGDMMSYWNFFPAQAGWGRIPVWGFADVLQSRHAGVADGERLFGYLPMSTHLVVNPDHVTAGSLIDAAPHRQALPPVYNQYTRLAHDPTYVPEHEDQLMLFRPLFMTAFLIDDLLADNDFFGARAVLLSSASSKTALGVAFLLHRNRRERCEVIGLTSPGNAAFVSALGCYDRVVTYDRIDTLPRELPVALVDMAGNASVVATVHHHFRDALKHNCVVGLTHWERRAPAGDLPGPQPEFFFAPTQIQKRTHDWGADGLQARYAAAWQPFIEWSATRIRVTHSRGPVEVERVYLETLDNRSGPDQGHVLSLWK